MRFRVHYDHDYERHSQVVEADSPEAAANIIRKQMKGALVIKTKVDKSIPEEA